MLVFQPHYNDETNMWEVYIADALDNPNADIYSFKTKADADQYIKEIEEQING